MCIRDSGFGIIPLSTQTVTYAGILIAFIFGALPLISQKAAKGDADNIGLSLIHI